MYWTKNGLCAAGGFPAFLARPSGLLWSFCMRAGLTHPTCGTHRIVASRASTWLRRASAAFGLAIGSNDPGAATIPAMVAACVSVSFDAGTPKYPCAAVSMPYSPCPK